jgi:hypothetical protein
MIRITLTQARRMRTPFTLIAAALALAATSITPASAQSGSSGTVELGVTVAAPTVRSITVLASTGASYICGVIPPANRLDMGNDACSLQGPSETPIYVENTGVASKHRVEWDQFQDNNSAVTWAYCTPATSASTCSGSGTSPNKKPGEDQVYAQLRGGTDSTHTYLQTMLAGGQYDTPASIAHSAKSQWNVEWVGPSYSTGGVLFSHTLTFTALP